MGTVQVVFAGEQWGATESNTVRMLDQKWRHQKSRDFSSVLFPVFSRTFFPVLFFLRTFFPVIFFPNFFPPYFFPRTLFFRLFSVFVVSFHFSTYFSSLFSISFHYSTLLIGSFLTIWLANRPEIVTSDWFNLQWYDWLVLYKISIPFWVK